MVSPAKPCAWSAPQSPRRRSRQRGTAASNAASNGAAWAGWVRETVGRSRCGGSRRGRSESSCGASTGTAAGRRSSGVSELQSAAASFHTGHRAAAPVRAALPDGAPPLVCCVGTLCATCRSGSARALISSASLLVTLPTAASAAPPSSPRWPSGACSAVRIRERMPSIADGRRKSAPIGKSSASSAKARHAAHSPRVPGCCSATHA